MLVVTSLELCYSKRTVTVTYDPLVYSRKLTPAEGRYGTYDRELVGLRDGCLHFRYQLLGVPFTVRTDHNSLRWFLSQLELTAI